MERIQAENMGKIKILIADDHAVVREGTRQILEEEPDLEVVAEAADGEEAIELADKFKPDLAIIDIRTPVMNGKQLYQSIVERHPDLIDGVIFTTGDLLGGDTRSFLEQSGRLFLPKPFAPYELRAIVREASERIGK